MVGAGRAKLQGSLDTGGVPVVDPNAPPPPPGPNEAAVFDYDQDVS
jgi:hypothetical protein